jgi:hypothetical protein
VNPWQALLMLAMAALILAPDNPVTLLVLFLLVCFRTWRTNAVETDDMGGSDSDCTLFRDGVQWRCDLT